MIHCSHRWSRPVSCFFFTLLLSFVSDRALGQGLPYIDNFNTAPAPVGWIPYNPPVLMQFMNQATYTIENQAFRIRVPYGTRRPLTTIIPPLPYPAQQLPADIPVEEVDDLVDASLQDPRNTGDLGDGFEDVYLARAGAISPAMYGDFFQAVDVVKWDDATGGNFFGTFSRIGTPVLLSTTGYLTIYLKDQQVLLFARSMSEIPAILTMTQIKLDPAQKYRFVTSGTGNNFTAAIYRANDLAEPLAVARTSDTFGIASTTALADALVIQDGISDILGLAGQAKPQELSRLDGAPVMYPPVGPAGVIVFNMDDKPADATFDNYLSAGNPKLGMIGFPGTPQVTEMNPAPNKVFHPVSDKISFVVRTFWNNTIPDAEIKMSLNGVAVPATDLTVVRNNALQNPTASELAALGLQLMGYPVTDAVANSLPPQLAALDDGAIVRYNGTLLPNRVYTVRVELKTDTGETTDNTWTFDTFEENKTLTIEAEDYNFNSGNFINNPARSGLGGFPNAFVGNPTAPVAPANSYYDKKGTPDVDFGDRGNVIGNVRTFVGVEMDGLFGYYNAFDKFSLVNQTRAYRPQDIVGTTQEAADTARPKTAAANVSEHAVWMMEGGEWLNYTRQFPTTGKTLYNAYLRVAAFQGGNMGLEEVTSSRSERGQSTLPLGNFNIPNTGSQSRYRLVPLTDRTGTMAVMDLKGERTFRLASRGTDNSVMLNYIIFVPAINAPSIPTSYKLNEPAGNFTVKIHKAPNNTPNAGTIFVNSEARAESQLAGTLLDPNNSPYVNEAAGADNGIYSNLPVINFEQDGLFAGEIQGDIRFPGITTPDPNWIAMSATINIQLQPGLHHWGVSSDDGFLTSTGPQSNLKELILGRFDGGRGAAPTEFYFYVEEAGVYPFRTLTYEGNGGASIEWLTVHPLTKVPNLLNGSRLTIPASFSKASSTVSEPGFRVHIAKARNSAPGALFPNSSDRAERHLKNLIIDPTRFDEDNKPLPFENEATDNGEFVETGVVNYDQAGVDAGYFGGDFSFPGVDPLYYGANPDWMSMEVKAYLDLPAGTYRMGVNSDDGFVVSTGPSIASTPMVLGLFEGGRGTSPTEFEFIITKSGVYPFRLIWYEGGGGANVEWYLVDVANKKRVLINDPSGSILAYQVREGDNVIPEIRLLNPTQTSNRITFSFETLAGVDYLVESAPEVIGPWGLVETVDGTGQPHNASFIRSGTKAFYRVKAE